MNISWKESRIVGTKVVCGKEEEEVKAGQTEVEVRYLWL